MSPTHTAGDIWIMRVDKRRPNNRVLHFETSSVEERKQHEERTLRGETCNGIAVSTYSPFLVFGVVQRTSRRNIKLLSKHATVESAMRAADLRQEG